MDKKVVRDQVAELLTKIFDNVYSRDRWTFLLGVSKSAISQWTKGETIPSHSNLRSIIFNLEHDKHKRLLKQLDKIKYKDLETITPNHYKFKGCETLNDYLLKGKIDALMINILNAHQKLKESMIETSLALVQNHNSSQLNFDDNGKILNELSNLIKLIRRGEEARTSDKDKENFAERLIKMHLRPLNKFLENSGKRPKPEDFEFIKKHTIVDKLNESKMNGIEIYNGGRKRTEDVQNFELPIIRTWVLSNSESLPAKTLILDDLVQMVLIIPSKGEFKLKIKEEEHISKNMIFISSNDKKKVLPKIEIDYPECTCYVILFSSYGIKPLGDLSTRRNYQKKLLTSNFFIDMSKKSFDDLINAESEPGTGAKEIYDGHRNNRAEGLLSTIFKTTDFFDQIRYNDNYGTNTKIKVSLVKFNYLDESKRINTLYRHHGHEFIIPLNNVNLAIEKCGTFSDEIERTEFNQKEVNDFDVFTDNFNFDGELTRDNLFPMIIVDPNTPHAFKSTENGESSLCLHIYIRSNVDWVYSQHELLQYDHDDREIKSEVELKEYSTRLL